MTKDTGDALIARLRDMGVQCCDLAADELILQRQQVEAMQAALAPLKAIADAYDANELDDEARKSWGDGRINTTPHNQIELYQGRGGRRLLTLADAMRARDPVQPPTGETT